MPDYFSHRLHTINMVGFQTKNTTDSDNYLMSEPLMFYRCVRSKSTHVFIMNLT